MGVLRRIAEFYKALADESRLLILEMLASQEMCVCEIIAKLNISQPAVSHHLKILRQAGLVIDKKDGKWIYYTLNEQVFEQVFKDYNPAVIDVYARSIRNRLAGLRPSDMRRENSVCLLEIKAEAE